MQTKITRLKHRMNLKTAVKRWQSFDTPAMRATQDERPFTKLETTPFVLSALRSKVYRSISGVATAVFRFIGIRSSTVMLNAWRIGHIPVFTAM